MRLHWHRHTHNLLPNSMLWSEALLFDGQIAADVGVHQGTAVFKLFCNHPVDLLLVSVPGFVQRPCVCIDGSPHMLLTFLLYEAYHLKGALFFSQILQKNVYSSWTVLFSKLPNVVWSSAVIFLTSEKMTLFSHLRLGLILQIIDRKPVLNTKGVEFERWGQNNNYWQAENVVKRHYYLHCRNCTKSPPYYMNPWERHIMFSDVTPQLAGWHNFSAPTW